MRMVVALVALIALPAMAQEAADEFDVLQGPSELDDLSKSADDPFDAMTKQLAREPVSVTIRALNKITAKFTDIVIPIDETADFGSLTISARYCDKRPPEEFPETTAFLQVFDRNDIIEGVAPVVAEPAADAPTDPATPAGRRIFSGWMFASSPALNPLEHAVYDVWVIDCDTAVVEN